MDLGLFFLEQPDQFVVLLDGFEWFHKDGLSAGTRAVDHALNATFLLDLHRNDESLTADGDEFILHRPAFGQLAQIAAQRLLDLALLLLDLAADAAEFRGSTIVKRAVGKDLVMELAQETVKS
jgi:hypothetical protein